ncbi:MAG: Sensory rhodopsin II transducer [Methanocella sp. PtaU1.Bin125]|nr:MAG: Sensory rhodopsin II transducer [Methanocella sp. PtaU1.Bin125]
MGKKLNTQSITVQLIALGLILSIVPIVILTYMNVSSTSQSYDTMTEKISVGAAAAARNQFDTALLKQESSVIAVVADMRVLHSLESSDKAALKRLVDEYKAKDANFDVITISDASGNVLASSASGANGAGSASKGIQAALAGSAYLGLEVIPETAVAADNLQKDVADSGTKEGLMIACARPVRDEDGKVIGAIVGSKLLNSDSGIVDDIAKSTNTDVTIFMGDTRITTTLKNEKGDRNVGTKGSASVVETVVGDGKDYMGKLTLFEKPYFVYYEPLVSIDGKNVGMLFTGVDISAETAQMNGIIMQSMIIGVVIAVLAIGASLFVTFRITKPIKKLVAAANDVAGGNLNTAIETGATGGEVGQLTDAIRAMVANIKDRIVYSESILKGVPDPMFVVDTDAKITYVNEAGARLYGTSVTEIMGKKLGESSGARGAAADDARIVKCLQTGDAVSNFETSVQMKGGKEVWVRGNVAPIRDINGRVTGAIELMQDITEARNAQQKIEQAEKDAREKALFSDSVLKSITDAHIVTDINGNVIYINEVALRMLGWSEKEALGRSVDDVIGVKNNNTRKALTEQRDMHNVEGHFITRNGRDIPVLVNTTMMKDVHGNVTGVNAMFKDITKEKEAKRQLAEITASANKIAERVTGASGNVLDSVQQVMSASRQISESISQIASGSQTQAKNIENINTLMHDMSKSISEVNVGARQTSEDAIKVNLEARKSGENARIAIKKMDELHVAVNDSAKIVADLGEKSKKIGQIVDMITAIAGQTNLLALNAAIEAARAGDAGRGFAVVAEEVRKLAEESAKAAEEINSLIGEVRDQTARAVESMSRGTKEVDESNRIVAESLKSLEDISRMIDTTAAKAQEIAAMTEKQAANTERVVKDVEDMASVIEESAAGAEEVSASSEEATATAEQVSGMASELAKIAVELKTEVGKLKVE